MLLSAAAAAAEEVKSTFDVFDIFILAFTVVIAIGVVRSLLARDKNLLAIGFGIVSLAVFVIMDIKAISGW